MAAPLHDVQKAMARYLRNPEQEPAPEGIEPRRLKIYEDLVYNNIEGFLTSGFPVLHSLYCAQDWQALVRRFMQDHRCHSPYFLEISQEFLQFLMEDHQPRECDPPFLTALAHYEWVELALEVSQETLPESADFSEIGSAVARLSPLAWALAYQFPVHRIGPGFRPQTAGQPTYLLVYRAADFSVKFVELNAPTARLLELLRDNQHSTVDALLAVLAGELGTSVEAIAAFAHEQLLQWLRDGVLWIAADTQAPVSRS